MRILLTGAGGMLGRDMQSVFADQEIICFDIAELDITVLDDVRNLVTEASPDFVIHCAAYTNVDQCEAEPEKAYLVNGIGARNMAMVCEDLRCPLVYISTDYVFDGEKGTLYNEWDNTNPVNQYGLSKLLGERYVSAFCSRYYIVRTAWLYGSHGRNFVDTILALLSERDRLEVVNDQVGCPTYTMDLAKKIRELTGKGYGTYHVTNSGSCSWYDFARMIAAKKGFNKEIVPVSSEAFKRPAKRPAYSVLGSTMLRLEGLTEMRRWDEALEEYLSRK